MPLVVPGINSGGNDPKSEWINKLVGKKLTDSTSDSNSFARQDLPKEHRIIEPDSMVTQDFKQDRLNVHLGKDGTVKDVSFK